MGNGSERGGCAWILIIACGIALGLLLFSVCG